MAAAPAPVAAGTKGIASPHAKKLAKRLHGGGWLEVEVEADLWGPHVNEWRERCSRGVFVHTEDAYAYSGLTVDLDTQKT